MRTRKTYLKMIDELGSLGFLDCEEHKKVKNKIDSRFNGLGKK